MFREHVIQKYKEYHKQLVELLEEYCMRRNDPDDSCNEILESIRKLDFTELEFATFSYIVDIGSNFIGIRKSLLEQDENRYSEDIKDILKQIEGLYNKIINVEV